MSDFIRIDLYTKARFLGGTVICPLDTEGETADNNTDASDRVAFGVVPGTYGAALLKGGLCVRTVHTDPEDDEEFYIIKVRSSFATDSDMIRVTAMATVPYIFSIIAGFYCLYDAGGNAIYQSSVIGKTPTQLLQMALDFLDDELGITGITIGTIGPTTAIDHTWQNQTLLAWVLGWLSHPLVLAEWRWERDADAGYIINIAVQVNIDADVPRVETAYNLRSHSLDQDVVAMGNVILPIGATVSGRPTTIAEQTAKIASIASLELTLEENCVPRDGALDGQFAVKDNQAFSSTEIDTSVAPNKITLLSSAAGFSVGHIISFRKTSTSNGKEVTLISSPASIAIHNRVEREYAVPRVYGLRNAVRYGDFPEWTSGDTIATGWTVPLGAGIAWVKSSNASFIKEGAFAGRGSSSGGAAQFRAYQNFYVHRRTGRSVFMLLVWVYFDTSASDNQGMVIQAQILTAAGGIPSGGQEWFSRIGPGVFTDGFYPLYLAFDAEVAGANEYRLEILMGLDYLGDAAGAAVSTAAAMYISAARVYMIDEGILNVPFYRNSGSNIMRDGAITKLGITEYPVTQHDVSLVDLSATFPADKITVGGNIRLVNPALNTDEEVRVISHRKVLRNPGESQVALASRAQTLTQRLASGA